MDLIQLEPEYFRACVPRATPSRWLCLFVSTDQQPAGLRLDPSQVSNAEQRIGAR
jgi:hypothetical protein